MTDQVYATFHDLKGQSVFITGGGSGIGAALTEGFLEQGAKVAFIQRSDASSFVSEMKKRHGVKPLFIPCDITDLTALKKAMVAAEAAHGPVTVLVNNAANDTRHSVADTTPEYWDAAMNVNLRPHFFTSQHFAPKMRDAGGGSIINYSSISYMMGLAGLPAYISAKAAITGLTRGLAREFGPDKIRVNAIMPGWVLTERQVDLWASPEKLAAHLDGQCLKEHLMPRDMVGGTLFLASKASRMMTGQALVIDGGYAFSG
jgi:galactose dehydrogenase